MPAPNLTRAHTDPLDGALPPLVLDRQRVVHSAAFRRLQHKTQVFIALDADHHRTRLTHTLEVAHIARVLAAELELSSEIAEVTALAHDLGHTPFGHAGERALDTCMHAHGGFEHNAHTLRVVEQLEHPIPEFRGLNLTRVVRECLAKHHTQYDHPGAHPLRDGSPAPPEAEVVDLADRLAYGLHDLQDGLYAGLIDARVLAELELWRAAYRGPTPTEGRWRAHLRPAIERMQQALIADVVSEVRIRRANGRPDDPPLVRLSAEADTSLGALEGVLRDHLYGHKHVAEADRRARRTILDLFDVFVDNPDRLPARFRRRVAEQGIERVTADYIAGMTDRFCLAEHGRLC